MTGKAFRLLVLLILATLLAVAIFIHTPFFAAMVRHDIEDTVTRATGTPLYIEDLSISPLSGHIDIHNMSLAETLSIKEISLKVNVLQLFLFKVKVENASIDGIHAKINLSDKRSGFHTDPQKLLANGFDTFVFKKLQIKNVVLDITGRDNMSVTFDGHDFLLQAGFDGAALAYKGVAAFTNSRVTVNGSPSLLSFGCSFTVEKNRINVTELTIARGEIRLSIKGQLTPDSNELSISGLIPLKEVTKFPDLQETSVFFKIEGNATTLTGPVRITDPKGVLSGTLTANLKKRTLHIKDLTGLFRKHTVQFNADADFVKKITIALTASVKGPLLKDFRANLHVEKDDEWHYAATIHGKDCGDGECHVEMASGRKPVLGDVQLNLPFLQTSIRNNQGWLNLKLDWVKFNARGSFLHDSWFDGDIKLDHLKYGDIDVPRATAHLVVHSLTDMEASTLTLQDGTGSITGSGSFKQNQLDLSVTLRDFPFHTALFALPDTRDLMINGLVSGPVRVEGSYNDPDVNGTVSMKKVDLFQLAFDHASATFRYHDNLLALDDIRLASGPGDLLGQGVVDFDAETLGFNLSGKQMNIDYTPLDFMSITDAAGDVSVGGNLDNPMVDARLKYSSLSVSDLELGKGILNVKVADQRVKCTTETDRHLDITANVDFEGATDVQVNAAATRVTIDPVDITASFNFHCAGDFNDENTFSGEGHCSSLVLDLPEQIQLKGVSFPFYLDGMWLTGDEVTLTGPDMHYLVNVPFTNFDSGELGGEITGTSKLTAFAPLIERETSLKATGDIHVNVSLDGTLQNPLYHGKLSTENGEVEIPDLPHHLTTINALCEFDPTILTIRKANASYGKGQASASGIVSTGLVSVTATVKGIPVDVSGIFADAEGLVKLTGNPAEERLNLGGNISLENGIINPQQLMMTDGSETPPLFTHLNLDLSVATRAIQITDPTMSLVLAPSILNLKGPADSPILLGTQFISKTSVVYINDIPMQVKSGAIRFENTIEIEPEIEINAGTRIDGYDINCRIRGTGNRIRVNFSSNPPLQERELLALVFGSGGLTTGSSQFMSTDTTSQDLQGAGAAVALNNLFAPFQNRVKQRLGVQRFSITPQMFDARSTPSPIVTFEKDISSRLAGIYSQSLIGSGENLLQFKYNMAGKKSVIVRKEIDGSVTVELELER